MLAGLVDEGAESHHATFGVLDHGANPSANSKKIELGREITNPKANHRHFGRDCCLWGTD